MKNSSFKTLLIISLASFSIISCTKESDLIKAPEQTDLSTTKQIEEAEKYYENTLNMVEDALFKVDSRESYENILAGPCAVIINNENTKTLTIDLGQNGCLGIDGQIRSGEIVVHYVGRIREPGAEFRAWSKITLQYKVQI